MRFSLKSVVSFVAPLLFSLSNVAWAEEAAVAEDFVMVVNAGTIEQAINDHSHLVVEFYAPWCGHCKKLAPVLSEAAIKMKEVDQDIVFAKMDCTQEENKAFKEQMGIKGFPSFRLFTGTVESAKEHRPPRAMPQLVEYFKAIKDGKEPPPPTPTPKSGPPQPLMEPEDSEVTVLMKDTFEAFIHENEFAVVEFYAPWCQHCKKLLPQYTKASIQLKDHNPSIKLAKIDVNANANKSVGKKFSIRGYPTIKIFKDGTPMEYKGPRDAEGMVSFLSALRKGDDADSDNADADDDDDDDDDDDVEARGGGGGDDDEL